MKEFSETQIDDMIKLKFGRLVTAASHRSFVSNRVLGSIFGVSGQKVRQLYLARFEEIKAKQLPLLAQMART